MKQEYLPHIFDEFSREHTATENKVVGTGLGLSIVKSFVELMDGKIYVESDRGKEQNSQWKFHWRLHQKRMYTKRKSRNSLLYLIRVLESEFFLRKIYRCKKCRNERSYCKTIGWGKNDHCVKTVSGR